MVNHLFSSYFGIGIIGAIILAFVFPYAAISLHPFAAVFLFLLMFLSGFAIDWDKLKDIRTHAKEVLIGNLLLFIVIPVALFFLSHAILTDSLSIYGVIFAALCPAAIVAPFFTGIFKGDKELAFLILISSSVLAPFIIPPMLRLLAGDQASISTLLLFKDIMLFVPLPLVCALAVKKYFAPAHTFFLRHLPILNFMMLALLIFILFGVSMTKLPLNSVTLKDLGILLMLALIQDFFLLLFIKPANTAIKDPGKIIALFNSASMKNIAIASTILLLYAPKAAIAPAMGFVAHALLFTPAIVRRLLKNSLDN